MSHQFREALAAMAPEMFEHFHGALEIYLKVAAGFWREARALAAELTAAREVLIQEDLDALEPEVLRARLGAVLALWEGVDTAWCRVQGAGKDATAAASAEHHPVLRAQLARLQQEHEKQAAGLQVLVDLAALMEGFDDGMPGLVVPQA